MVQMSFKSLFHVLNSVRPVPVAALAKGARTHTGFLPESDPAPVVEFFTRTGITADGGGFHTD